MGSGDMVVSYQTLRGKPYHLLTPAQHLDLAIYELSDARDWLRRWDNLYTELTDRGLPPIMAREKASDDLGFTKSELLVSVARAEREHDIAVARYGSK